MSSWYTYCQYTAQISMKNEWPFHTMQTSGKNFNFKGQQPLQVNSLNNEFNKIIAIAFLNV